MNKSSLPAHVYLQNFNPARLTHARELRGLTKKALAEQVGKTPSALTQYESGGVKPELATFNALALALGVPPAFFAKQEHHGVGIEDCHFRAKRNVSQALRREGYRYGIEASSFFSFFERQGVLFPEVNVPRGDDERLPHKVEQIANDVRRHWGMGDGPIHNLLNILEAKGIFIVLLPGDTGGIDAFSFWLNERPYIFLSMNVPASRLNFDLAHELAHLVMHDGIETGDSETENAAHRFASAFLAPAKSFSRECSSRWNYEIFSDLKKRWRISKQAALFRARQLNIISESSFRWGMIDLGKRNERTTEKDEFSKSYPLLFRQAIDVLDGTLTLQEMSDDLGVYPSAVERFFADQYVPNETISKLQIPYEQQKTVFNLIRLKDEN
jgi:Zn-dependent peptidase ImmA (M78 family)/DNA-binding XRE family transcriptional regulator